MRLPTTATRRLVPLLVLVGAASGPSRAQSLPRSERGPAPWNLALDFLGPYGPQNFSRRYVRALQALLEGEHRYGAANYLATKRTLARLWDEYPTGRIPWGNLPTQPFGINIGSPPSYYGLRMLTDTAEWRVASGAVGSDAPRSVRLTVLVVGESAGIEPRTVQELEQGTGIPVVHDVDPRLAQDGYAVVHESLALFREYVLAMTEGRLSVEVAIEPLPATSLAVEARVLSGGGYYAGLVNAWDVWPEVEADVLAETDWWWLLYPSHVPEQYPDFENTEFITGGMGTGQDGGSPLFIIDDRWLVRKPPHLGDGPYSSVERRAYLPQWLQHEFFHHLFRTYPEFGLEAESHQWFDLDNWPPDFEGRYEADYFHEALVRRLQSADPPLHVALRYSTADAPWDQLTLADVLASYRREPVENPWHIGTVEEVAGQLRWRNDANVTWDLQADLGSGVLLTGPDCPYYGVPGGDRFQIVLQRDEQGDLTSEVRGFRFLGELYQQQ